jgi:hypothetical protein
MACTACGKPASSATGPTWTCLGTTSTRCPQLPPPPPHRRDPIALPAAPLAITDGAEIVDAVVVAYTERRTA